MLGNILLVLTALLLIGLLSSTTSSSPGGDAGVGRAYAIFFCFTGFALSSGLLTFNLVWNNCFDWVQIPGSLRNLLVFGGWIAFVTAMLLCQRLLMGGYGDGTPQFISWLSKAKAGYWLPLLMLVPAFMLLNFERQSGHIPDFVKIPMMVGFLLSVLMCMGYLFGLLRSAVQLRAAKIEDEKNEPARQREEDLELITMQTVRDPITIVLPLTGRTQDSTVRAAAVAKIIARPDWEAELIVLLGNWAWDTKVFAFIDGNQVEHPALFIEPINRTILRFADELKDHLRRDVDIELICRVLEEHFKANSAIFRPSMLQLQKTLEVRAASNHKEEANKKYRMAIKNWLDSH
jgi:hypothetical protein